MNYYNAPITNLNHLEDSAYDLLERDKLGKEPKPFQAIYSFLKISTPLVLGALACGLRLAPELRHMIRKHEERLDLFCKNELNCPQVVFFPLFWLCKLPPLLAVFDGMFAQILNYLRAYIHQNTTIYYVAIFQLEKLYRRFYKYVLLLVLWKRIVRAILPCIFQSNISYEYETRLNFSRKQCKLVLEAYTKFYHLRGVK